MTQKTFSGYIRFISIKQVDILIVTYVICRLNTKKPVKSCDLTGSTFINVGNALS